MKKLGKLSLSELKTEMLVVKQETCDTFVGGYREQNGQIIYSQSEYEALNLAGSWSTGYVEYNFGSGSFVSLTSKMAVCTPNNNILSNILTSLAIGVDCTGLPITISKELLGEAGEALAVFTKTGGIIGIIASGGPAAYNIVTNGGGTWKDWTSLGLSVTAAGLFELSAPLSIGVSISSFAWDIYNITDGCK
jgi:hypothetical protein